ncbi:MAG: FHA domain-containing protein [Chthoniobacter sp.]
MAFSTPQLGLFDCFDQQRIVVEKTPFIIGNSEGCDLRLDDPSIPAQHCVIQRRGSQYYLLPSNGSEQLLFDGAAFAGGQITSNEDHTIVIGRHCIALRGAPKIEQWLKTLDGQRWFIFDRGTAGLVGPFSPLDLSTHLRARAALDDDTLVLCQGLKTMGFYAEHLLPSLPVPVARPTAPPPSATPSGPPASSANMEYGEFTCPVCWLKFDRGDTMSVAVHASLRGDPILGEEHLQRFHATRFNDRGQALDAMNIPAPDLACPHCRRKLPPGFLDLPHLIFSIVGAPSSGKSYYLSVLVKILQNTLFQDFGVTFRDADPSANVILNQMKTQLFSAATPQDAFLIKTDLEGAMYESLPRLGRMVKLPKPFIFNLSSSRDQRQDYSVVFYDNAGEHFEPTRNSAESPGAQHIAAASGIFFLFDPLHNAEFKRRLTGLRDPQVDHRRLDQQDVILAETEVRIKSLLGLDARQKIATPLAVIVGKSDTWLHLLGERPLESPVRDGRLALALVADNSARVRKLLLEVCPAIVANAEAVSSEVMYFAASPLGCSPVEFTDAYGAKMIGPDPQKIQPQYAEIPTLWVLSRVAPGIVPALERT